MTLQQYTADQEMYAISKNKKKQQQRNNYFKYPSPIGMRKFAISCGILARFPFSHYFQYFFP